MRPALIALSASLLLGSALASGAANARPEATPALTAAGPGPTAGYERAPWWMRTPIIAATGEVQTHVPANRAGFSAQFNEVDPSLAVATRKVTDRIKTLARTLQAYGADKAQVETSLSITPIFQQYRDKQGEIQNNQRSDRIEAYLASVRFSVQIRDTAVLERAYAAVVSAHPASMQPVSFQLEPGNEVNVQLFRAAIQDASRRAKLAAEATGARLGRVMLIDPTARACETDVLVSGAGRMGGEDAGGVEEVSVTAQRMLAPAPPPAPMVAMDAPPVPGAEVAPGDLLLLQPPLQLLSRKACVIYALD